MGALEDLREMARDGHTLARRVYDYMAEILKTDTRGAVTMEPFEKVDADERTAFVEAIYDKVVEPIKLAMLEVDELTRIQAANFSEDVVTECYYCGRRKVGHGLACGSCAGGLP